MVSGSLLSLPSWFVHCYPERAEYMTLTKSNQDATHSLVSLGDPMSFGSGWSLATVAKSIVSLVELQVTKFL